MVETLCVACRIKARVFSYACQVYALMLGQLSGAFSLNEICDAMVVHCKKLFRARGLLTARRNTFSNANQPHARPGRGGKAVLGDVRAADGAGAEVRPSEAQGTAGAVPAATDRGGGLDGAARGSREWCGRRCGSART